MRLSHLLCRAAWTAAACMALAAGCGRPHPPVAVVLPGGLAATLPGEWSVEPAAPDTPIAGLKLTRYRHDGGATITTVVMDAPDLPFARQVQQDRNNLNLRQEFRVLLETPGDVAGLPAHTFIVTGVENGVRLKAKVVSLFAGGRLVYITLKAAPDAFEAAAAGFNAFLDRLPRAAP
ncbi:MAG: hypothetical protein ABIF71_09810 [Planctomycetota bacterium]